MTARLPLPASEVIDLWPFWPQGPSSSFQPIWAQVLTFQTFRCLKYQWSENQQQQAKRGKKINPSACLCFWLIQQGSVWNWIKFHFVWILGHISWPVTSHLVAIILRQRCNDLAHPQSDSKLVIAVVLLWFAPYCCSEGLGFTPQMNVILDEKSMKTLRVYIAESLF